MRIAVFSPNLIGDTVMATPAFRALRRGFPDARIDLVIKPNVAPTLDGAPWFDGRILFDARSKDSCFRSRSAIRQLRESRLDLAVLFPNSIRSALIARLGGARHRVGYDLGGRRLLLTDRLLPVRDASGRRIPSPAIDHYLGLLHPLGCPTDSIRMELFTTPDDEQAADDAWSRLGLPTAGPVVCLNNGGAFGPAKAWPSSSFATLARRLTDERGVSVLVVCGPAERESAREIVALADRPSVVSLADEPLSIGLTKACIRRSALLITTDSGPRHFAGAFGVPVVSLFGPTFIAWTRTYLPRAIHLQKPVDCGPCQRPVCPLGHHRCMRELPPDVVFAAAVRLLGRAPATVSASGPAALGV